MEPTNLPVVVYEFGDFFFNVYRKQLFRKSGEPVKLSRRHYELLLFLVKNRDIHYTARELKELVWDTAVEDSNVATTIFNLRRVLGEESHNLIETQGRRYRFTSEVIEHTVEPPFPGFHKMISFGEWARQNKAFELFLLLTLLVGLVSTLVISRRISGPDPVEIEKVKKERKILTLGYDDPAVYFNDQKTNEISAEIIQKKVGLIFTVSASFLHIIIILAAFLYYEFYLKASKFRKKEGDFYENDELKRELKNDVKSLGYASEAEWTHARKIAQMAFDQYQKYWNGLLLVWFLLYVFMSVINLLKLFDRNYHDAELIILSFLNNFNTLMVFLSFAVLYKIINTDKEVLRIKNSYFSIGIAIIVLWTAVEFVFFYLLERPQVLQYSSLASGLFGGVSLALFIGCLQSKLLGIRGWWLPVLYFYIVLQPLFIFFDNSIYTPYIISFALVQKCLLILIVFWLLQSGRFLYYFVRVRPDYEKEWEGFKTLLK